MVNLLNSMNGGGLGWASVDSNYEIVIYEAVKTTQRPNSRVICEKNDIEVVPFYCVVIHHIDTRSVRVALHVNECVE